MPITDHQENGLPASDPTLARGSFGPSEVTDQNSEAPSDETLFAAREVKERVLEADIHASASWRDGKGLFQKWEDKVEMLNSAYPLLLHMIAHGKPAVDQVRDLVISSTKKRRPGANNIALLAVRFVARPDDVAEHKAASDYAYVLRWALHQRVRPDDFVSDVGIMRLTDCIRIVRDNAEAKRKSKKLRDGESAFLVTLKPPGDAPVKRLSLMIEPRQQEALLALGSRETVFSLSDFADAIRSLL